MTQDPFHAYAASKFFTNENGNTLLAKFQDIEKHLKPYYFDTVVGYLRASGYFQMKDMISQMGQTRILVGLELEALVAMYYNKGKEIHFVADDLRDVFAQELELDIQNAKYKREVEEGIKQFVQDVISGKVQIRIHKEKSVHAKIYIFRQEEAHSDYGRVITGSSNFSDNGLVRNFEFNVELKDRTDVEFSLAVFEKLWKDGIEVKPDFAEVIKDKTYLRDNFTPYEIYHKFLIEYFGESIEFDASLLDDIPTHAGIKKLSYQIDAVKDGFDKLKQYNGFFLSDVVGLGKTIVGAMIARRFIFANGVKSRVLIIAPPALKKNWMETVEKFGVEDRCEFVTNGSLHKVTKPEKYDLIIVDEAHKFRSDTTESFNLLQQLCKTPCKNKGLLNTDENPRKKVLLISATPLNNKPEDIRNMIYLFQDAKNCTIDGIPNLQHYFAGHIERYKKIKAIKEMDKVRDEIKAIYDEIRKDIIQPLTVRRTRTDIWENEIYKTDAKNQGIEFPQMRAPHSLYYNLGNTLDTLYDETIRIIANSDVKDILYAELVRLATKEYKPNASTLKDDAIELLAKADKKDRLYGSFETILNQYSNDIELKKAIVQLILDSEGKALSYVRYQAIMYLSDEAKGSKFSKARLVSEQLAKIMRTLLIKRLDSSFTALRSSLKNFLRANSAMIKMFENGKIFIVPDLKGKVTDFIMDGEDDALETLVLKLMETKDNVLMCSPDDFHEQYLTLLQRDQKLLELLVEKWDAVAEDPKLEEFLRKLPIEMLKKGRNPEEKLVVFTESSVTANYLHEQIQKRTDIKSIAVSSANREEVMGDINTNFDANLDKAKQKNDYSIVVTTDVLAEGVNLHRSNSVVNYDTPWNSTRLMQRIGRVNRIGSVADSIHVYNFYPTAKVDNDIDLKKRAFMKLQAFHTALGEDNQIYSTLEEFETYGLYREIKEEADERLKLLLQLREFQIQNPDEFRRLKNLPKRARCGRVKAEHKQSTITYVKSGRRDNFFYINAEGKVETVSFLEAVAIYEANIHEKAVPLHDLHHEHIEKALESFEQDEVRLNVEKAVGNITMSGTEKSAKKYVNGYVNASYINQTERDDLNWAIKTIEHGVYAKMPRDINKLKKEAADSKYALSKSVELLLRIIRNYKKSAILEEDDAPAAPKKATIDAPEIIISESFVA
jgi:superfamily II DNA/RNA helicase